MLIDSAIYRLIIAFRFFLLKFPKTTDNVLQIPASYTTFVLFVNWLWYQFDAKWRADYGLCYALIKWKPLLITHTKLQEWQWKDPLTHRNRAKKSFLGFLMMLVSGYFNALLTMINVQCLPDYAHTVFLAVPMIVPKSLNPQRSKDTPYAFGEVTVNFKKKTETTFWNSSMYWIKWNWMLERLLHGGRLSLYRALNYL